MLRWRNNGRARYRLAGQRASVVGCSSSSGCWDGQRAREMKLSLGRRDDARVNLLWGKLRAAAELTFGARERRDNPGFERLPGSLSYGVCRQ